MRESNIWIIFLFPDYLWSNFKIDIIENIRFCCCCRKCVLLRAHACIPACVHVVDNQKCCHRLFCCTDRSKGGQYLRSTDDVTPVELFLERGLKKAGFFFLPSWSYYYSKPFTSASSSQSLFNLAVLVNFEPPVVISPGWTASCIQHCHCSAFST